MNERSTPVPQLSHLTNPGLVGKGSLARTVTSDTNLVPPPYLRTRRAPQGGMELPLQSQPGG